METPSPPALEVPAYLWRLWAKWPRSAHERRYHPVLCHMIDVASVAQLMWARALTQRQRERLATELACSDADARQWIAFWAGLHDLGKASPAFQTQLKPHQGGAIVEQWLRAAHLSTRGATWQPHGAISVLLLEDILSRVYGMNETLTRRVAALVGAHHGLFFSADELLNLTDPQWIGDQPWIDAQERLARLLAESIGAPAVPPSGLIAPSTGMLLAGFISVADWVGSNTDRFPPAAEIDGSVPSLDLRAYADASSLNAALALDDITWDDADLSGQLQSFTSLFPGKKPRPVQEQSIALARQLTGPGLILLEVPMGEGKTEAAMYLADAWSARLGMRGAYFALPTQATSNQMFGRIRAYLERRFRDTHLVNLHLAHGMAALSEPYETLQRRARMATAMLYDEQSADAHDHTASHILDVTDEGERGAVIAATWFTSAKRTLLASYGVGTVDQSLLAVLQVKHVFIRLFGLSAKTVILDEVHAYDMYMSTLMERLLQWLGALGAPVVLLSATLPAVRRQALLAAYARGAQWPAPVVEQCDYPRITSLLGPNVANSAPVDVDSKAQLPHPLRLRWAHAALPTRPGEAFPLADALREALSEGGCVAIVCNTVRRAQDLFESLQSACATWPAEARPALALFHARYPFTARQQREAHALSAFGLTAAGERNPQRPARTILVATQVIEQSLDLDFDLMVSDLAPVDLLLQRAGRLHRHRQNDHFRPALLRQPELWIAQPAGEVGGSSSADKAEGMGTPLDPTFEGADEYIYSPHILLRTWYALRQSDVIRIPEDIERLIEVVYAENSPPPIDAGASFASRWITTRERDLRAVQQARSKAQAALILPPSDAMLFYDTGRNLEEDAPEVHRSLQAQTRDGDPSLQVVLLDAVAAAALRRSQPPSLEEARALLGQSLSLSHRGLVNALLADPTLAPPSGWMKTPWLRHHRLITLDAHNQARVDGARHVYTLTLDATLGVKIESRKKAGQE